MTGAGPRNILFSSCLIQCLQRFLCSTQPFALCALTADKVYVLEAMLLFHLVLLFGCCGGSLWALCTPNLQFFLVLGMDLTSVVSALRLLMRSSTLFACLLGIMLEACLLGILSDQAIFFFSRPNKASTAGMIAGNGNIRCNVIFERVLMLCYLMWIFAASTASEKSSHLLRMPIVVDCCSLQLTFVQSGYLYHVTVCAHLLKFLFDSLQRSTDGMNSGNGTRTVISAFAYTNLVVDSILWEMSLLCAFVQLFKESWICCNQNWLLFCAG